jgi:hypothetical protein
MNIHFRLFVIGMLLLITTMAVATQFALSDLEYQFIVGIIPDQGIHYIGSDNSTDGIRVLRRTDPNSENFQLFLGNISSNSKWTYSSAFAIVNEDRFVKHITHIDVISNNNTNIKIWLHDHKKNNANSMSDTTNSVLMYNNGTIKNYNKTIAWTLAPGDRNASTICSNITDIKNYTSNTSWDSIANVRYSLNNDPTKHQYSDYVWVQIEIVIPADMHIKEQYLGSIHVHFKSNL